jgi:hypothetical protein
MGFTMTHLALRHNRMLTTVTEGTGECLVLGHRFFQLFTNFFMARHTEISRGGQGIVNFQRMVGRMTAKAVTGYLAFGMGLMAF